jgi:DNA-binding response OmpR family regulator
VVEDEQAVRTLIRRVLERAGYTVVEAADGEEALQILRDGHGIAMVVTDLTMPRLGGRALVAAMREAGDRTPVIVTSGYSQGEVDDAGALDPGVPMLAKPWAMQDLLAMVRAELDRASA